MQQYKTTISWLHQKAPEQALPSLVQIFSTQSQSHCGAVVIITVIKTYNKSIGQSPILSVASATLRYFVQIILPY